MPERPDNFVYQWLTILPDSMRFFLAAAKHYQAQLDSEVKRIESDVLFSTVFTEREVQSFDLAKEAKRFKDIADRLAAKIDADPEAWDYELTVRHREVRLLKALGQFYLAHLQRRRNEVANEGTFSTVAIQALDARISRFAELTNSGVLAEASPWPLLLEPPPTSPPPVAKRTAESEPSTPTVAVRVISRIDIVDQQLRERCLDLLDTFDTEGQTDRFDTVITEATRILEDRIRRSSGADSSLEGVRLMGFAFGGPKPLLVISADPSEQEAAHLMFRGVFGFVRNPFHHRLVGQLAVERALQILGMIDYLLLLVQNAAARTTQDA